MGGQVHGGLSDLQLPRTTFSETTLVASRTDIVLIGGGMNQSFDIRKCLMNFYSDRRCDDEMVVLTG